MTRTGADFFLDSLEEYGVTKLFGNPGTTELPLVEATKNSDIDYVLALHEDVAVGMAAGYASTRRYHSHRDPDVNPLGVVNLHVTPGLAHGLGNVYGAKIAGAPLLMTAGDFSRDFKHEEPILSGDLVEMIQQFTKWSAMVNHIDALPDMVRRAVRVALTPPTGPVFLGLPIDIMMEETDNDIERLGSIPDAGKGDPLEIQGATEALIEADNPVLVLGDGVARSKEGVDAAIELAEATGARVHGEILACEVNFPTEHPQWISFIPPDEGVASFLMDTDTLVFVGCSTNTTLHRHEGRLVSSDTKCIHVSDDPWQVGKNESADVAVIGDPGRVCREIASGVESGLSDEERDERVEQVMGTKEMTEQQLRSMGEDEKPEGDTRSSKAELVDAMSDVMPDAYIVDEGVTAKYALLTRYGFDKEQYISNKGGGLGYGLPASVGAAIAERETGNPREVIGYIGDGSYLYYPQSIYSAVREGLDLTVVVPDNRNYRILKDNIMNIMGGDEDDYEFVGMDIDPPVDLTVSAESYGADAEMVESPDELHGSLEDAVSSDGVTVLDVLVHD